MAPKAKRVIYLFQNGAPSQLDLFDYKPGLMDQFDKDLPESVRGEQRITGMTSGQTRFHDDPLNSRETDLWVIFTHYQSDMPKVCRANTHFVIAMLKRSHCCGNLGFW